MSVCGEEARGEGQRVRLPLAVGSCMSHYRRMHTAKEIKIEFGMQWPSEADELNSAELN